MVGRAPKKRTSTLSAPTSKSGNDVSDTPVKGAGSPTAGLQTPAGMDMGNDFHVGLFDNSAMYTHSPHMHVSFDNIDNYLANPESINNFVHGSDECPSNPSRTSCKLVMNHTAGAY